MGALDLASFHSPPHPKHAHTLYSLENRDTDNTNTIQGTGDRSHPAGIRSNAFSLQPDI